MRTLVWFRGKDLRVADHAPLRDAVRGGEAVPLFVVDPYFFEPARAAEMPHRIQFLLGSLHELAATLAALGSRLVVVRGKSVELVPKVAELLRVDRVVAHRWSEPVGIERDRRVAAALGATPLVLYEGETLAAPGQVVTGEGRPFAVFTPFSRAFFKAVEIGAPIAAPRALPPLPALPRALVALETALPTLDDLGMTESRYLVPSGEQAARARLARFLRGPARDYEEGRNALARVGTSRLSQDLKFGTLSARAVWHKTRAALAPEAPGAWNRFALELVWREFAYDILRSRPDVLEHPFRSAWRGFPWRRDAAGLHAWRDGATGYPVVDAAARQLLAEGWVPGRARMIAASFLTKHLLVDFRHGEAHYMKFLTDGDWASNDLGWQWTAGCGVDAQPWFRIFNPVTQAERFDPEGAWVRRWVPELARLDTKLVHRPWEASPIELAAAKIELGRTYPRPIVDHATARGRFLAVADGHLGRAPEKWRHDRGVPRIVSMLPEQRATSYAHDPALGTVVVVSESGPRPELSGDHPARLLFDAARHLVGVDVAPDAPERLIVMLGPHEKVARVEEARVRVEGGGRTVTLHGAAAKLVAPGASPYVF